ncbi:glycoside hydrolase family 76 protein [Mucilaginibacter sp.]|uniref:glycoside hydrolase family 76 protein n=1 Tax=Mucilaginibacter sp. TaxID=1882438 RepID=UPI00261E6800|nr:glycoside hydrolase family 76 protein [Mucilaginibacter sp.]MDB4923365.1 putative hydrolase [Mucilaginibacter sp.]
MSTYSIIRIKSALFVLAGLSLFSTVAVAQQDKKSKEYLQRAELMYSKIWKYYRVPKYKCLFLENYPSSKNDSLDYMQGDKVKEKEVSFLWPYSGVFSATNALLQIPAEHKKYLPYLDSMAMGMEKYLDTKRKPVGYQAYPSMFEKDDRYYDDNGLVGIEYLEAYFNTKNPLYLTHAKTAFKFIISGWDDQLGGGVTWLEGHKDQKPACSNGMATLVALKLYQATKDPYYLTWGKRFYNWMHTNLRDSAGAYWNDKKTIDGKANKVYYTYNSGSMLEAGVLLYQFTHNKTYLKDAQVTANGAYKHFSDLKHDPHLSISMDLPWFVTVLFRGYEALYKVDGNYNYIETIGKDLDYAWQNTTDKYGLLTNTWTADDAQIKKPKWLLDEACIAELYARLSKLESSRKN